MKITDKVQKFINGLLEGLNQTEAYRRAYDCRNWKDHSVTSRASVLANSVEVQSILEKYRAVCTERSISTAADVATELLNIHSVDTSDIVQHRRLNCRYCNGVDHNYQWKDKNEYAAALLIYERTNASSVRTKAAREIKTKGAPSCDGGFGFRFNAQPIPSCPNCLGEGIPDVFIADTRYLSKAQKKVIAGIKQGKEGVEVKFRDQDGALKAAGQMLGGFKQVITLQNPDGTPIKAAPELPSDPILAAQVYAEWVKAATKG